MKANSIFANAAIIVALFLAPNAAHAAASAGKAVGVDPAASNTVNDKTTTLVVGADVGIGDKIVTGPAGQVQLVFSDDTHLVVGPGSSLVIESYLLRGDNTASKFAVNALSGTFRFITGKSDHDAYRIATPTGTIGVRGTAFDFTVGKTTIVALFRGAVELCTLDKNNLNNRKCVTLDHKCEAGEILPTNSELYGHIHAMDDGLHDKFKYIQSQNPLLPDFHVDESRQCFANTNPDSTGLSHTISGGAPGAPPSVCEGQYCGPD